MEMLSVKLLFGINLIFIFTTVVSTHKNFSGCSSDFGSSLITVTPVKYYVQLAINPEERIMSNTADIMILINSSVYVNLISKKKHQANINLYTYEKKINPTATKIMAINITSKCDPSYNEPNLLQNYSYCEENILSLVFKNKLNFGYYCMHLEFTSDLSDDHIIKIPYYTDEGHKK